MDRWLAVFAAGILTGWISSDLPVDWPVKVVVFGALALVIDGAVRLVRGAS
jgi:hypothetical protein